MTRKLTYAAAIQEATSQLLTSDDSVFVVGEGVPDKSGIFGSTKGLADQYPTRVFDSPLSENAVTGVVIGAGISNMKPIYIHMRSDFSLLGLDQVINNAAKWHYMFGKPCNITIRMIVGRGWGQGPQHSNSYQNLYAAIPGLKVVMPTTAHDVKGLLISAVRDPNPVIFIEHRWLYNIEDTVLSEMYQCDLNKSKVLRQGEDITVVSMSYSTIEALKAYELLKVFNVRPEVLDLISCSPIDIETIGASVRKTGRLLVVDTGHQIGSVGAEVVRQVSEKYFHHLKSVPIVLGLPDYPCPTSHFLTENYYPDEYDVANMVLKIVGSQGRIEKPIGRVHDVPDASFKGPF